MRQRLTCVNEYNEELEKKLNTSDKQINVMQENIDVQSNEISKERIIRERIEREFQELMEEFNNRNIELQVIKKCNKNNILFLIQQQYSRIFYNKKYKIYKLKLY